MREIRFRAWDSRRKEMCHEIDIYQDDKNHPLWWTGQWRHEDGNKQEFFDSKNPKNILMQFTGLLDKNGKEIFEGDICSISSLNNRLVIEFHDGAFGYWMFGDFVKQSESAAAGGMQNLLSKYEIIGNIYENKNLLSLTNQGAG